MFGLKMYSWQVCAPVSIKTYKRKLANIPYLYSVWSKCSLCFHSATGRISLHTLGLLLNCILQYCNAGDLHNYVLSSAKKTTTEQLKEKIRRRTRGQADLAEASYSPRRLAFEQIISFFRDIASGLNHLHSNGFIHRDLKPSNCLLNDTGIPGQELRVLVSDFGEVQIESEKRKSTGATGTISYCAPEVLRRSI